MDVLTGLSFLVSGIVLTLAILSSLQAYYYNVKVKRLLSDVSEEHNRLTVQMLDLQKRLGSVEMRSSKPSKNFTNVVGRR